MRFLLILIFFMACSFASRPALAQNAVNLPFSFYYTWQRMHPGLSSNPSILNIDEIRYEGSSGSASCTISPTIINAPGTPKEAVFCRLENTLTRKLRIGMKLRVQNPPPAY